MTTYFSILIVLFGIALLWKAVSLSGEHFISSNLCQLRAKAGMLALENPTKYSADKEAVNSLIESCQHLADNFSIRKFIVAIIHERKYRDGDKSAHVFSEPELEKIAAAACDKTLAYLLMVSPSLFLVMLIVGSAMFLREGYGTTRQTLATMTRSIAEYGFAPLDDSRRLA